MHHEQQSPRNSTRTCGTSGIAGVTNGKLIYFKLLSIPGGGVLNCYHEGKGYSIINTYRSALSITLCSVKNDRDSLGSDP